MGQHHNQDSYFGSHKKRQRGIYLLPNLFTTTALFAGFYAIVAGMKGYFDTAAVAIFIAMIADALDGRVARLTNTQSAFGAQYDSLSDLVAFGVAPSLMLYSWSLMYFGKIGWIVSFLFTAATALRLARFNTQVNEDKRYFQGLPCPSGAGIMAGFVWMATDLGIDGMTVVMPLAILSVFVSGLMVSNVRYSSFKEIDFKGRVPFLAVVVAVFIITAVALEPAEMLTGVFGVYVASGPVMTLWQRRKRRKMRQLRKKVRAGSALR